MTGSRTHAVVVGGSLAGLLAARVLADHYDQVTLVERDRFPLGPGDRPGVPQGRHLHVLWTKGLELIEEMFPGAEDELLAAGAVELRIPADLRWLTAAGWRGRFDLTRMLTFSRGLLDHVLRLRLRGTVEMRNRYEAVGLIPGPSQGPGRAVRGVEIRKAGVRASAPEPLDADLVIDATGRGSRSPEWLARLGYPFPQVTRVDPLLGYASRYYAIPPDFDADWKALYLQADPPATRRTGGLFPQEGGRWIVSLSGAGRDYGPTDERAFAEFARGLRSPLLYEAIRTAEPLTPISGFRRTANHRRHFERLPDWPEGYAVVGDAVCAFNPIYGQGMSVAALQAAALDELLGHGDPRGLTRRFQRLAARCGSGAWLIATGEDLRYEETEGSPVRLRTKIINRYVDRVVAVANADPEVCRDLLDVLALKSGPAALFRPATLARVLAARTTRQASAGPVPARTR